MDHAVRKNFSLCCLFFFVFVFLCFFFVLLSGFFFFFRQEKNGFVRSVVMSPLMSKLTQFRFASRQQQETFLLPLFAMYSWYNHPALGKCPYRFVRYAPLVFFLFFFGLFFFGLFFFFGFFCFVFFFFFFCF